MATTASKPSTDHKDIIAPRRRGRGRVHSPLVHGHQRPAEELLGRSRGARGRPRRGHGLRRLVDHRLQPDRGVGHDRDARPGHLHRAAVADRRRQGQRRADVLRRAEARRRALRGRSALRDAPGARPGEGAWASTPTTSARSSSSSTSRSDELGEDGVPRSSTRAATSTSRRSTPRSDLRRDTVNALKAVGIPVEYTHHEVGPSQHEIDMRYAEGLRMSDNAMTYRIVVKEIAAEHGVYATFMPKPLFGENGSGMHTHQSLFSGRQERLLRRRGRRITCPSAAKSYIAGLLRHAREIAALFAPEREQLQAAGAGLRGAGLLRLVAAQPLGARPRADLPPRQGAGDALRAPLSRPVLQPLPDVRGDAARGARRDRAGLRVPGADGAQPLRALPRRAGLARNRAAPRDARRGDRGARRAPSWSARRSATTSSSATSS